ncbi:26S proteasome regulatory subunit S14, putative [Theileria equi strain WA]|uniref:26S proteasome regulatory subunit S14, putative n=1 Tax=Theileria equi strain WA TaxID=1537102 RepID=L1LAW9_THEEQ|nr:26S proteasome regulatory subunit S14, putative [Theileria equi strain WA]EKX72476.1 26S proteasome regulatory subunit S14, putative [Theileria equi strain WA]|eukprot:XP_004831928.1 26S proteasome regulatory subunit S14, putative [Theileria equi strain WA]
MSLADIDSAYLELKRHFPLINQDKSALEKCVSLTETLKDSFAKLQIQNGNLGPDFLIKMRDFLEMGAIVAVESRNVEGFKCFYLQLQNFYFDEDLPRSERMGEIFGTWMLHLLSENRIGDLYMFLERIPEDIKNDEKIAFVINLERSMMEGDLARLIDIHKTMPCEYYKIIAETARNRIATSMELAYKSLKVHTATKLLKLETEREFLDFVSYYNQCKIQTDPESFPWKIVDGVVIFQNDAPVKHTVPSRELLHHSIEYINELEKIV